MAPFLTVIGNTDVDKLTSEQAYKLRELCLKDYKQQLVDRAELIHARFEKVTRPEMNVKKNLNYKPNILTAVNFGTGETNS